MSLVRALAAAAAAVLTLATPAVAQVHGQTWQPRPGAPAFDQNRYEADRHRYDMDRLRAQADQREMFARQLDTEARLNRLNLESARRPEPVQPLSLRALRSPEEERILREAATARRQASTASVGQVDAWLDRAPR